MRTLRLLAAALLLLPIAAGCSRNEPVRDDRVLIWRVPGEPKSLDPAHAAHDREQRIVRRTHEGLTVPDPETGAPLPGLAESWEVDDGGRRYRFHLRSGVRFHDGHELVAADVVYSLSRHLDPATGSAIASLLRVVEGATERLAGDATADLGITELDPAGVEIRLVRPHAALPGVLSMAAAGIIPVGTGEEAPGTGPFRLVEWERGRHLRLTRFADYRRGAPELPGITFLVVADDVTALSQYEAGELDVLEGVPDGRRQEIARQRPGELLLSPIYGFYAIGINHARPDLRDRVLLRRALSRAVDRDYICNVLQAGKNRPADQIAPPGTLGWAPDLPGVGFDLEEARSLLAAAGFPGGRGLRPLIAAYPAGSRTWKNLFERLQADLSEIGVTLELRPIEWAVLVDRMERGAEAMGEIDLFRTTWNADYPDADDLFTPMLASAAIGRSANVSFRDEEIDRLLDAARASADPAERDDLYRRVAHRAAEQVALIPVYWGSGQVLVSPAVEGLVLSPLGEASIDLYRARLRP